MERWRVQLQQNQLRDQHSILASCTECLHVVCQATRPFFWSSLSPSCSAPVTLFQTWPSAISSSQGIILNDLLSVVTVCFHRGFLQYATIVFFTDYATSVLNIVHIMTVSLQNEMGWGVTLSEILIFLILNPIAPAIICALWMIFRVKEDVRMEKHYRFLSKLTCLINGTFESPVQIILTLFLFTTGRIQPPWQDTTEFTDSFGNKINLGSCISIVSFGLCWVSLFKNVIDSYQYKGPGDVLSVIALVLPNVIFRIFSYFAIFLWVREYIGFLIALIFVVNLIISAQLKPNQSGINMSSTSFCSIFCVVGMPSDPSIRNDLRRTSEVDPATLKKMTLLIAVVSLPIIGAACWLAYGLRSSLDAIQDINNQLTSDQEWFLMIGPYSGLVGLSLLSCLFFWALFNTSKVPGKIKTCLNVFTVSATILCLVLSFVFFPASPTSVVLTVEKENGGIEILEGFVSNSTSIGAIEDINCHAVKTNADTKLKCGHFELLVEFANTRKGLSTNDHRMIVLDPNPEKNANPDVLKTGSLNLFLLQSEKLQTKLQKATCLICHHEKSNMCKNIMSPQKKIRCTSTCASVPKTFLNAFKKEEIEARLETEPFNTETWIWKPKVTKFKEHENIDVLCEHTFFETRGLADCHDKSLKNCKRMKVQCMGNERWKLKNSHFCRTCANDDECLKQSKGNTCLKTKSGNACYKKLLFIGFAQKEEESQKEMVLFDPRSSKTETCTIRPPPVNGKVSFSMIENVLHAFDKSGTSFKFDKVGWNDLGRMVDGRSYAADIVLRDGRWFVSGGESRSLEELSSTEFLTKEGI